MTKSDTPRVDMLLMQHVYDIAENRGDELGDIAKEHCRAWSDFARTLERELTALRAVSEWRPIETVPHTGQSVLVCADRWRTVGHWHRSQNCLATCGPTYERFPADEQPTHWMPLPPPPESKP